MRKLFVLAIVALMVLGASSMAFATVWPPDDCRPQDDSDKAKVWVCIVVDKAVEVEFEKGFLSLNIDADTLKEQGETGWSDPIEWTVKSNTNDFEVEFKSLRNILGDLGNLVYATGTISSDGSLGINVPTHPWDAFQGFAGPSVLPREFSFGDPYTFENIRTRQGLQKGQVKARFDVTEEEWWLVPAGYVGDWVVATVSTSGF